MKAVHQTGDVIRMDRVVETADLATFETGNVHPFYGTFALGRDVEWACRQFVLNMKDEDEEGIGTFLNISHKSPAMLGDTVTITATLIKLEGNTVDCEFVVHVGERLVAEGTQGQKIMKKEKVARLIDSLKVG
jgi:fluoroacetyl-CoA thioesterase